MGGAAVGIRCVTGVEHGLHAVLDEGQLTFQHIIHLGIVVVGMHADRVTGIKIELRKQGAGAKHSVGLDDVAVFQCSVAAPDIVPHLQALFFFTNDHNVTSRKEN